jgi:hypothetical protein
MPQPPCFDRLAPLPNPAPSLRAPRGGEGPVGGQINAVEALLPLVLDRGVNLHGRLPVQIAPLVNRADMPQQDHHHRGHR